MEEIVIKCPTCGKGVYLLGSERSDLDWYTFKKAKLTKTKLCTDGMHRINADSVVEVIKSDFVLISGQPLTVKEVGEKYILIIMSEVDMVLAELSGYTPDDLSFAVPLSQQDIAKILDEIGMSVETKDVDIEDDDPVNRITILGNIGPGNGFFVGSNNNSTVSKNGITMNYAVFGSNMIIKSSP